MASLLIVLAAISASLLIAGVLHDEQQRRTNGSGRFRLAALIVGRTPLVAHRVARIRDLRFRSLPRPRVISAARFRRLSEREARDEGAQRDLAADELEAKLLGLVEPSADLSSLPGRSTELAAAAYDPRNGHLYVIRDAIPGGQALSEFVLSHELTHALEDQRFQLTEPGPGADDRSLAELALAEGTATAVMTEYGRRYSNPLELAGSALGLDTSSHGVPDFLVEQLEFAYLRGAAFVNQLYRDAAGWNIIDIAIRDNPPVSTEQILHPMKYLLGETPAPVSVGAAPGAGWHRIDSGTVGEFATAQLLGLGVDETSARRAAGGWGGDAYRLWGRGTAPASCTNERACRRSYALVVAWRWDSARDRRQFERTLRDYARVALSGSESGLDTWSLPGGWAAIGGDAGSVRLALAPEHRIAELLVGPRRGATRR